MALRRTSPLADIDENNVRVGHPKNSAAGVPAVAVAMKRSVDAMGVGRTARSLPRLNQVNGFDCQGCAWPDPDPSHRHPAEFCENGAKAVADEATTTHLMPHFFEQHSLEDLQRHTDYWLNQQGRLIHPVVRRRDATHYEPISWEEAFGIIGETLRGLADPDEAVFYTSGKVSNEAAYAFQLFVRSFGTNNLPDCSNMCHESTSVALAETIGIGKGSVSLEDVHQAKLIVISGQNPGTNHPRMLSALEIAKQNGAKILSINPLFEAGLKKFKNPQTPKGVVGPGTGLSDLHLPIRINGDLALWQAIGHLILKAEETAGNDGSVLDRDFIERHTTGFDDWAEGIRRLDWDAVESATGLTRAQIQEAADMLLASDATVHCWAMGITQHRNAVATIKEFVNVAFLQGNIGKPGAGLCPVRGHSNVQGDRTMGIWEKVPDHFLDALRDEYGFEPPREHGLDTVDSIRALRDGQVKVFIAMGGNFVSAAPDTVVTEEAMEQAELTVNVATKLNRSHVRCGRVSLILPPLGRSEQDRTGGVDQRVTVEDSMSAVHASRGPLKPASPFLRSEVDIVCSMAEATLGTSSPVPWSDYRADYTNIRKAIAHVVPGCEAYDEKVDQPGGFVLPHPPRDSRTFPTKVGKGLFSTSPMEVVSVPEGRLLLQGLRSHDQFNTTIYGLSDRYRGVSGGRRVVFLHADDIAAFGFVNGDLVDIVSEWHDGTERAVPSFRIVEYETPRGCAAAYYPEVNPLTPLDSTADGSNQPVYKSMVIRLEKATRHSAGSEGSGDAVGSDAGHKSDVEPDQLS
jgi:molybdopterin-dependent oxidoreductase alpha subunit